MNDFILLKIKSAIQHIALRFLHGLCTGRPGCPGTAGLSRGASLSPRCREPGLKEQGPQQGTLKCPET